MSETDTEPKAVEPSPEATPAADPKPEVQTDWEKAYKGLQTTVNRQHTRIEQLQGQLGTVAGTASSTKEGVDVLLKQSLGEDGYKAHQESQRNEAERAAALAGTQAAIAQAKEAEATKTQAQTKAKNQEEIKAEADALAERTLRTKGIDKVDLGKGQSISDRGFVSKVRGIDRNTPEGEAEWQALRKEALRGTLVPK